MKKAMTILLSLVMVLSLTACGKSAGQSDDSAVEEVSAVESESSDAKAEDADVDNAEDAESADDGEAQPEETEDSEVQGAKVLVAYFSATHTTQGVAEHIANGLNADLYEIVPEEPYTDADLNYNDNNSRTTIEMNDPDVRPAISGSVEHMDRYDIVFIGYPKMEYGFNCVLCA